MHYLVDGYNLAHWLAGDADLRPDELRALLLQRLQDRLPRDAESVRIFWDVRRPSASLGTNAYLDWCTMHHVPDADEAIIDAVWASDAPARMIVVSRDREVTGRCRQLGARVTGPAELLGQRPR